MPTGTGVDVLIVTALPMEHDAARAAAGAAEWTEHDAGTTAPYRTTVHHGLSVALARPTRMGGRTAGAIATALTDRLRPSCLAMTGICAGHPGETAPGDVVVAAPAFEWDEGKHTGRSFRPDAEQFPLDRRWLRAVQDFRPTGLPSHGIATDEEAEVWFLETLLRGRDPRTHPARGRYSPRPLWDALLPRLESNGLIVWDDGFGLTPAGRDRIRRILYTEVDPPERLPFEVFAGPMASGSAVVADGAIWPLLESSRRDVRALDMEAATIATVAADRLVPHWLVAKGVTDHADRDKDDRFQPFAARASAEVLFALLRQLLPASPARKRADIPDRVRQAVLRQLRYDWPDLADVVGVPSHTMRRFRAGDEPYELWTWLAGRDRLADLPDALAVIDRADLSGLLRPYL